MLILTVAKYQTPAGKKLQDDGVTPQVLLASAVDDQADGDDGTQVTATTPAPVKKVAPQVDQQLTKALDILKGKTA
jgi:carboxyl-terminal processing protease